MVTTSGIVALRFGYGPLKGRLPEGPPDAALSGPDTTALRLPGQGHADLLPLLDTLRAARRARDKRVPDAAANRAYDDANEVLTRAYFAAARRDIARAVTGDDPYRERLVRFWADHFTVRARQPRYRALTSAFVDDAIRPHVAGRFGAMLRAVVMHPAMLIYLDQQASVGPNSPAGQRRESGLNENLARELLELHTLGVGSGYTQTDVTQLAKLLTGLTVDAGTGTLFEPRRAEPGAETVLGRRYGGDRRARVEDVWALLDDLAERPETARHIARKIAVHFVADTPDPGLVADLTAVWQKTGGDLLALSRALVRHPAALTPVFAKVRQPFDFIVAALRALGVTETAITGMDQRTLRRALLNPMGLMGQPWQAPRGPDGWSEAAEDWITPAALAARIDWAMQVPALLAAPLPDPRDFVDHALAGVADDRLRTAVARSENRREGVGLVLASPAFNRR